MKFNVSPVEELRKENEKQDIAVEQSAAVESVKLLTEGDAVMENLISKHLGKNHTLARAQTEYAEHLAHKNLEKQYDGEIFTRNQIKNLAFKYNLRFLNSKQFASTIPVDVIQEIRRIGQQFPHMVTEHNLSENYFILAPEKMFIIPEEKVVHEKIVYYDPVLFYRITGTDNFRMIKAWGKTFTIFRRFSGILNLTPIGVWAKQTFIWGLILSFAAAMINGGIYTALHPAFAMTCGFTLSAVIWFLYLNVHDGEDARMNKRWRYTMYNWDQATKKVHSTKIKMVSRIRNMID